MPRHADADTLQSLIVIVAIWCGQINCNAFYFPIPGFNLPPDAPLNKVRRISMEYIYICTICTYIPPFCRRYQTQIGFNGAVSNCRKKNGFFSFACVFVFRSSVQFVAGMKMMALECRINAHLHGERKVDIVMIVLCCVLSFRKILLSIHRNACDRNCDMLIEDSLFTCTSNHIQFSSSYGSTVPHILEIRRYNLSYRRANIVMNLSNLFFNFYLTIDTFVIRSEIIFE